MSKADGQRKVQLGGREFTLRLSIRAIAELEERWQCKGIGEVMQRASTPGARELVDLFYAVTRSHHSADLTYEECLELLDMEGLSGVTAGLLGAIADSADDAAEEAEKSGKAPPAT